MITGCLLFFRLWPRPDLLKELAHSNPSLLIMFSLDFNESTGLKLTGLVALLLAVSTISSSLLLGLSTALHTVKMLVGRHSLTFLSFSLKLFIIWL